MKRPDLSVCEPRADLPPFRKEGLLAFAAGMTRFPRPPSHDRAALRALTEQARDTYDEDRKNWHANLGPYNSTTVNAVLEELWEIVDSNRQTAEKVKPCAAVDGPSGTGKSTLLFQFAKQYHLARTERAGTTTPSGVQRFPVALTTLSGAVTRKGFNRALLDFYGWPAPKGFSADELTPLVHAAVLTCNTEVLVVDDVHFLEPTTKDGRDVSNHMKNLSSVLDVTFVFGGVDIDMAKLLTEGRSGNTGRQSTGRRWTLLPVEPFPKPNAAADGDDAWIRLLNSFERDLVLARAYPGMLSRDCRDVLWAKTGGNLASLTNLLKRGCHRAITNGTERLDDDLFLKMRGDSSAQRRYEDDGGDAPKLGTGKPRKKKAA